MWTATRRVMLAVLMTMVMSTALAGAGETWVRFGGSFLSPLADADAVQSEFSIGRPIFQRFVDSTSFEADGGVAPLVAIEYRPNDDIGWDLTVNLGTQKVFVVDGTEAFVDRPGALNDGELISSEINTLSSNIDFISAQVALNFYLDRRENLDLFVAPIAGFKKYDDLEVPVVLDDPGNKASGPTESYSTNDDLFFGLAAGVGFSLGDRWEFRSAVRWTKQNVDVEGIPLAGEPGDTEIQINPLTFDFAFGYKF